MSVTRQSLAALGSLAGLVLLAGCNRTPTAPLAALSASPAIGRSASTLRADPAAPPSGERRFGRVATEPAYDDASGQVIYILTPENTPLPTHASGWATVPLYIVEYPANATVGTLDCMGVPGNCPDHDGTFAGAADALEPVVYGDGVLGHDHLLAAPGNPGASGVIHEVHEVLFTPAGVNHGAENDHLTTEAEVRAAVARGDAADFDLGLTVHTAVVSRSVYRHGTPVG